jgi:DNA-directed RNA polymerase specialized sigma24 family protein
LAVSCSGCPYEDYRQAHTEIPLSALDSVDDSGEVEESFEPPAEKDMLAADLFEAWREEFLNFVSLRAPMLVPQATLRTLGYRNAEISRKLGVPSSTVTSRGEKLEDMLMEYLASKDSP